jgi:two-component sensor histidine kinase
VAGLGLLGLTLSILLALFYGRRLAATLRDLCRSAEALGRGEWIDAAPTDVREVNQVGRSMALAAQELRDRAVERDMAARRQQLLIHELNHRVKNTLATVQSLAWQSARPGVPPQAARERFQERLLALSRTHNLLNETSWEGAPLRTVIEAELAPYMSGASRVRLDGPEVYLPPTPAVVLGMAFHELAANAVKHGALSAAGRVAVRWQLEQAGAVLTVDWSERDGPQVEAEPSPGFGSRLLRRAITRELDGHLDLRYDREGVCCSIIIPIGADGQQAARASAP